MARKFKNGDKVKVLDRIGKDPYEYGFRKGSVGVITGYDGGEYPYNVKRKNGLCFNFMSQELELIERKKR